MTTKTTTIAVDERTALSDRTVALLRTAVPGLWAAIVTTILRLVSPLLPGDAGTALAALLRSELALTLVVALVLALWYWLWRRVEHLVPDWLVRLVLGSARTPGYSLPAAVVETGDGTLVTGTIPEVERLDPAEVPDPDDDPGEDPDEDEEASTPAFVTTQCSCGATTTARVGVLHTRAGCGGPLDLR